MSLTKVDSEMVPKKEMTLAERVRGKYNLLEEDEAETLPRTEEPASNSETVLGPFQAILELPEGELSWDYNDKEWLTTARRIIAEHGLPFLQRLCNADMKMQLLRLGFELAYEPETEYEPEKRTALNPIREYEYRPALYEAGEEMMNEMLENEPLPLESKPVECSDQQVQASIRNLSFSYTASEMEKRYREKMA